MVRLRADVRSLVLLVVVAGFALSAQVIQPREPMPSFEVVSIKPWSPARVVIGTDAPQKPVKVAPTGAAPAVSDRVHFIGQIELLIGSAYGVPYASGARILGGPEWMRSESDRYEVTGKIDAARYAAMQKMSPAEQKEQVSLMEQSLLADRFQFKAHIETRELPQYALVVAKSGSKMDRAPEDAQTQLALAQNGGQNEVQATAVSMDELARAPFLQMDKRQIVNKTGLQGRFNFTLKFSASMDDAPTFPTALQEQLGLRLVSETGPAEVVVIDRIEKPSGN